MKVKIIANLPQEEYCSGISEYIGMTFNAHIDKDEEVIADIEGRSLRLFKGEYEVLED